MAKVNYRCSGENRERVMGLHDKGLSTAEIASVLDLSESCVCKHKRALGIPPQKKPVSESMLDEMRFLLSSGESVAEVARRVGVTEKTVYQYFPTSKKQDSCISEALSRPVTRFMALRWRKGDATASVFDGVNRK
ncbi:helix-turn-helix domain-containing protein [uncultured Endozoicomonas sp.]|uniref:helix-turn-helix domain-containing protein n=1 Tax=uncultured Endozoicomonas sp. TaxID=432652 RepID=UPI00262A8EB8|nr:helix-turn-helix domain-containing protein [uncultured Endozoicomonas sp.]